MNALELLKDPADKEAAALVAHALTKTAHIGEAAYELAREVLALKDKLEQAERWQSCGLLRRHPNHHSRQPKPQMADPIDDSWISTGRE